MPGLIMRELARFPPLQREQDTGEQWDGRNAWPPLQWLLIQGLRRSADAVLTARTQRALHMAALSPVSNSPCSASTPTGIRSPSRIGTPKVDSCSPSASNPTISGSDSQRPASVPVRETAVETATAALGLAAQLEEAFLSGALAGWERSGKMMEKYDAKSVGKGGSGGEYELQVMCGRCFHQMCRDQDSFNTVSKFHDILCKIRGHPSRVLGRCRCIAGVLYPQPLPFERRA